MFKKTIKKSNLKETLIAAKNDNQSSSEEEGIGSYEPSIKKQQKLQGSSFTTQNISEKYKKHASELNEDLLYKASGDKYLNNINDSCATNEIDTERDRDARTIALRNMHIREERSKSDNNSSKTYKGLNAYANYIEKSENSISASKFTGSLGPIRAPKNIRVTCRFDYNPSLCKDFHDTGFCGFGDSCIYLHDRGDYKPGWQLEKEWEDEQKKRIMGISKDESEEEDDGPQISVPRICGICDKKMREPIQTRCEHYFCESCALSHNKKSNSCFSCNKLTYGIFNNATKIIEKLKEAFIKAESERPAHKRRTLDSPASEVKESQGGKDDESDGDEAENSSGSEEESGSGDNSKNKEKKPASNTNGETQENVGDNDVGELIYITKQFEKKNKQQKMRFKSESDWML